MKRCQAVIGGVLVVGIVLAAWRGTSGRPVPQAVPGLPEILVERGFGGVRKPVTITFWPAEVEGMEGAITLVGTGAPPPNNTQWVFADPTPVWNCFAGVKTHRFKEGNYAAAEASLVLRLGPKPADGQIVFLFRPGWATVNPPKGYPEGGDWTFDPEATRRLAQLVSSTPPTKIGTASR